MLVKIFAHLPVGMTFYRTRQYPIYVFQYVFHDAVILFPALYLLLNPADFFTFFLNFVILHIISWSVYEIHYLINDFIAVKFEDKPFYRDYTKVVNFKAALLLRILVVALAFMWLNSALFILWILVFALAILLHNLIRQRRHRILFYPYTRLIKVMFTPIMLTNLEWNLMFACFVVYLPMLMCYACGTSIGVTARYYNFSLEEFPIRYYTAFLIMAPLQLLLLNGRWTLLLGSLAYALGSVGRAWKKLL